MIGALATVPLPDAPADEPAFVAPYGTRLQTALAERHRVQVPIILWPAARRRFVRISSQIYNTPADVDRLGDALAEELARERAAAARQ
jgi:isopenicillin-N epimerase